jgi:mannose/fructose/N-acetylgalactosamine-specific phosphotransferase system component IID
MSSVGLMPNLLLAILTLPLVQLSWSYAGSQGLGFCVILLALAGDKALRRRLWQEYRGAFNTNPLLAGTLAGVVYHHELRGEPNLQRLSNALQSSLGAVGDVFFWKNLRPGLSAAAVAGATLLPLAGPLAFLVPFAVAGQGARTLGMLRALENGRAAALELTGQLNSLNRWLVPAFAAVSGFLAVRAATSGPVLAVLATGAAAWLLLGVRRLGAWLLPIALLILFIVKVVL